MLDALKTGVPLSTGVGIVQLYREEVNGREYVRTLFYSGVNKNNGEEIVQTSDLFKCKFNDIDQGIITDWFYDPMEGEDRRRSLQILTKTGKKIITHSYKTSSHRKEIDVKIRKKCHELDKLYGKNEGETLEEYRRECASVLREMKRYKYRNIPFYCFEFYNTGRIADQTQSIRLYNSKHPDNPIKFSSEIVRLTQHYYKLRAQVYYGKREKAKTFIELCEEIHAEFKTLPLDFIKMRIRRLTWRDKILGNGSLWKRTMLGESIKQREVRLGLQSTTFFKPNYDYYGEKI